MTQTATYEQTQPPTVEPVTDEAIANYLRYSCKIAEITALAQEDAIVVKTCAELGITIPDAELQAAGDAFRMQNKLLSAADTLGWLEKQKISAEDWTQGIRLKLLTQKLKEHLFLDSIDTHYLSHREEYRRAAFSQILVPDLPQALEIVQKLRQGKHSFAALAIEHSKAQPSAQHGGFVGIRFLSNLNPEIKEAIANVAEGEILDPIKTHLGYHILRVEKWFPPTLDESVRLEIMELLWKVWLAGGK